MGIRERMAEIRTKQLADEEADQLREQEEETRKRERFNTELPEALRAQADLFSDLKNAGIIALLEEMTHPQDVQPVLITPDQELGIIDELSILREVLPLREKQEMDEHIDTLLDGIQKQEWRAQVMLPEQYGDGSIDKSKLVIKVDTNTARRQMKLFSGRGRLKTVEVTYVKPPPYSGTSRLTIRGMWETYEGSIDEERLSDIETGLAKAFLEPGRE